MKKTKISYFEHVGDTVPKEISLKKWLKQTIKPPTELKEKVLKYRRYRSKNLKLSIPAVTISATFKKERNLKDIKNKTNYICLDIDRHAKNKRNTCNPCIDFDLFKDMMMDFKACLYVGYSVSSDGGEFKDGMYAIVRLHEDDSLKRAFKFYRKKLARVGVNLDESCKDYTRLRFFSYDPSAYFNPDAKVFRIPRKAKVKRSEISAENRGNDYEKVLAVISVIESNGIDITSSYDDWYKIAGSLYNAFGENGRDLFHRVSKFHSKYNVKKTDSKFDGCMKMGRLTLSSFFHIATSHGIRY